MTDDADHSARLQERELLRAIAKVTGRPPRVIEIPPPHYEHEDEGTDNGVR